HRYRGGAGPTVARQRALRAPHYRGGFAHDDGARLWLDREHLVDRRATRSTAALDLCGQQGGARRHDARARHGVRTARHPGERRRARRGGHRNVAGEYGQTPPGGSGARPDPPPPPPPPPRPPPPPPLPLPPPP